MTIDDEQIRAAFDLAAERAAGPEPVERIRAQLARASARTRQRRLLVLTGATAGAAAAATAVGVPLALDRRDSRLAVPVASPPAKNPRTPVPFRLGWLPDGFVEHHRYAQPWGPDSWSRGWRLAGDVYPNVYAAGVNLMTRPVPMQDHTQWPTVTVNGVTGRLHLDDGQNQLNLLVWPLDGRLLTVQTQGPLPHSRELLVRLAESVIPDPAAAIELPMRPAQELGVTSASVGRAGPTWRGQAVYAGDAFTVTFATSLAGLPVLPDGPAVRTLPLRRGTARTNLPATGNARPRLLLQFTERADLAFSVETPARGGTVAVEDVVRFAEELVVGPTPDMSWYGR